MTILRRKNKKGASFVLKDSVSIVDASSLHALLKESLDGPLSIDMSEVCHVDTSIVQLILAVKEAMKKSGGSLRVINPPDIVMEALNQAGFGSELGVN